MTNEAEVRAEVTPTPRGSAAYGVRGVSTVVVAELRSQLEAVVGFADYCAFLTAGAGSNQAAQLVEAAQALYDDTMELQRRHGHG